MDPWVLFRMLKQASGDDLMVHRNTFENKYINQNNTTYWILGINDWNQALMTVGKQRLLVNVLAPLLY